MVYVVWGDDLFVCKLCGKDYWADDEFNNPILNDGLCGCCAAEKRYAEWKARELTTDEILDYFSGDILNYGKIITLEVAIKPWLVHK
jgi:hypothetical protein